jgi:hypothetical protein
MLKIAKYPYPQSCLMAMAVLAVAGLATRKMLRGKTPARRKTIRRNRRNRP